MSISAQLREQVKERAAGCCEYCLLPSGYTLVEFEIDHVIAKQHGGEDKLENLALACFRCNRRKGTNLASLEPETQTLVPLFSPRMQIWTEHFELLEDGVIEAKSQVGRVTVHFMQLNTPARGMERSLALKEGLVTALQQP